MLRGVRSRTKTQSKQKATGMTNSTPPDSWPREALPSRPMRPHLITGYQDACLLLLLLLSAIIAVIILIHALPSGRWFSCGWN